MATCTVVQLHCEAEDGDLTHCLLLPKDLPDQLCLVDKPHCLLALYTLFPA